MGSYPALAVQPPQNNTLGNLSDLLNARQQMQMRPLQLQQEQQQVAMGAQQLKDQQAITAAWKSWDGKSPESLTKAVLDNGGSGAAANQLDQQMMARQQQHMALDKDAFDLQQKRTDRLLGRFDSANDAPDEQLYPTVQKAIKDSADAGDISPQEAAAVSQQLQQLQNNPQAMRASLATFEKAHMLDSKLQERAKTQSETQKNVAQATEAGASAQAKQAEAAFYQNNPGAGAPGVPAEVAQQADWLRKNPTKTASDYPAAKATQTAQAELPTKLALSSQEARIHAGIEQQTQLMMRQQQQDWNIHKDAADKISTEVYKPYADKMTNVTMARTAIQQASSNPVAARAAIFKAVGVAQPEGAHRVLPVELAAFKYPGGITDQIKQRFQEFLTGKPWDDSMTQAAMSFIDGQEAAAKNRLNSGINETNLLYGTKGVGQGLQQSMQTPQTQPAGAGGIPTFAQWKQTQK